MGVSFPIALRILFAAHAQLLTPVLQIIHRVIARFLIKQAKLKDSEAQMGAVTLIQRFGSAANLNIHLHCLVLDGVYRSEAGAPVFQQARAPSIEELHAVLAKIITRLMRLLTRQGYLIEEQGMRYLGEIDADCALTPLQAASCTYQIALGSRAGQKVLSLRSLPSTDERSTPGLCAKLHGISLHAAVRCGAGERKQLEHLCRYITRPAIANERLRRNGAGQVVLQLKSAYQDGTSHVVMSPLQFMQRLAALVPRPRLHLIRFHGVLAPHAKLRAAIVPAPAHSTTQHAAEHGHHAPARISWARLLKRVFDIDIELPELRRSLEDHRRHRGAAGDRENPRSSGTAHARAAAHTGPATRSVPSGLIRQPRAVLQSSRRWRSPRARPAAQPARDQPLKRIIKPKHPRKLEFFTLHDGDAGD